MVNCYAERERERARARSNSNNVTGYVLKADIKHYFQTVDHDILISILSKRIRDTELLELIRIILENHKTETPGKGMPLGNLTSQFFANIYLAELDHFVKHELKAKYYLRYVDDFVILDGNEVLLLEHKAKISRFLKEKLKIELHPEKSSIIPLRKGITFLGFRCFYHYRLLKKSNQNRIERRLLKFKDKLADGKITRFRILCSMAGWEGYAKMANTYKLRQRVREKVRGLFIQRDNKLKIRQQDQAVNRPRA